jgi:hypothetical protein
MKRLALVVALSLGLAVPGLCQIAPNTWIAAAYNFTNITTDATTTVVSGPSVLGAICINTTASTETITIYNNTAASGTKVGTITLGTSSGGCYSYNAYLATGLTIVTAVAAGDITVIWHPVP